jgi:predicted transcriptional regulator
MLKTVRLFKVEEQQEQSGIDESLNDIKEGRVYKAKSVKDLMSKI